MEPDGQVQLRRVLMRLAAPTSLHDGRGCDEAASDDACFKLQEPTQQPFLSALALSRAVRHIEKNVGLSLPLITRSSRVTSAVKVF